MDNVAIVRLKIGVWDTFQTLHSDGSAGVPRQVSWVICSCGLHPGTDSAQEESFESLWFHPQPNQLALPIP